MGFNDGRIPKEFPTGKVVGGKMAVREVPVRESMVSGRVPVGDNMATGEVPV